MKKIGRPKSNNPKNVDIKIRVTEALNEKLLKYCEKENITKAEAIRRALEKILED